MFTRSTLLVFVAVSIFGDLTDAQGKFLPDPDTANVTCTHNGKQYKYGEHIDTPETSCFVCICRENWVTPSGSSCAIIDCPWNYYQSKPHCSTEYIDGQCCPELRCSAAPPHLDSEYLKKKRDKLSTDGYNITVEKENEITIYCIADNSTKDLSENDASWSLTSSDGSEKSVVNGSHTDMKFFPPGTWAMYIDEVEAGDEGVYTCTIKTTPPQIQVTRLIVRIDPRPPVIHEKCHKNPFNMSKKSECPGELEELPWYYNVSQEECVQHTEKSCSWSSENNFPTMSACWDNCLDDCYAPPDPGTCLALFHRFYYDSSTDACSEFIYGGCIGNLNNFHSVEECEDACAKVKYRKKDLSSERKKRSSDCRLDCSWNQWLHYLQLGCKAIYEKDSCCPKSFDCNEIIDKSHLNLNDSETKCEHNGVAYKSGEMISFPEKCLACPCKSGQNNLIGDQCKPLGCDLSQMNEKLNKGCIPIYKNDVCCPVDWQCPPSLKTKYRQGGQASLPDISQNHCTYGGQNYSEGFDLITGHSPCLNCSCLTPPIFTCVAPTCPPPPSADNPTLRCKKVYKNEFSCCSDFECWNILEETNVIGLPQTENETSVCNKNPCEIYNQCLVNYTECYLGECQRICHICGIPRCAFHSNYVERVNHCPTCEGKKTPEDACEFDSGYCPEESECIVVDEKQCLWGNCEPVCVLISQQVRN